MQHFFSLKIVYRPHNHLQPGAYVSLSFLNLLNNLKQCILTKIREVDQLPFTKLCEFEMLSKWQYNNHTYTYIVIEYIHNSFKILRISNLDSDIHNVNVRTIISHNIYFRQQHLCTSYVIILHVIILRKYFLQMQNLKLTPKASNNAKIHSLRVIYFDTTYIFNPIALTRFRFLFGYFRFCVK